MGRKLKSIRNVGVLLTLIIAGLYFFGYIELIDNSVSFHVKYTAPTFNGSLNYFLANGPLIIAFVLIVVFVGIGYVYTRD